MPTIVQTQGARAYQSPGTNIDVTLSTAPADGNLILFVVSDDNRSDPYVFQSVNWSDVSATELTKQTGANESSKEDTHVGWRYASGDTGAYSLSTSVSDAFNFDTFMRVFEISGIDSSYPFGANIQSRDVAFEGSPTFNAFTTTASDELVLFVQSERGVAAPLDTAQGGQHLGWTEYIDPTSGAERRQVVHAQTFSTPTTVGPLSVDGFGYGTMAQFSIVGSSGSSSVPLTHSGSGTLSVSGTGKLYVQTGSTLEEIL